MQAHTDQRLASGEGLGAGLVPSLNTYTHISHAPMHQNSTYNQLLNAQYATTHPQTSNMHFKNTGARAGLQGNVDSLANAFGGLNIQNSGGMGASRITGNGVTGLGNMHSVNTAQPSGAWYYQGPDGRVFVSGLNASLGAYQTNPGPFNVTPAQAQYLQQASYHMGQTLPNMPQTHTWNGVPSYLREVPELAAPRRNSLSSNEENGPHTPFFGGQPRVGGYQPSVSMTTNSPMTWTTPSPEQLSQSFYPQPLAKTPDGHYTYCDLDAVCQQEPAIPTPVPAIFSGDKARGTLEKSLNNVLDTTNVYIRGLRPDTTDEMLHAYGARFGDIVSAKSMLDQQTGLCKGFGFVKYHNFTDGENCIRGFFHWGYEAKWARISHNEKLKTLGDVENTNLYVANLPTTYNEATLKAIFISYDCMSAKILRDQNGLSRGVGFARFATPEICDRIIQGYNGKPIGQEGHVLSIRYSDTEKQKQLKNETAERRQYKTNEYNASVFAPGSPYAASPVTATFPSPLQPRVVGQPGYWPAPTVFSPLYQGVAHTGAPLSTHVSHGPNSLLPKTENIMSSASRYSSRIKIESPSVAALAKRTNQDSRDSSPDSPDTISGDDAPVCKNEPELDASPSFKIASRISPSRSSITKSSPAKSAVAYTPSKL
ncbi:hypothetical protein MMC13_001071 [Lambiella insularis]|nr:hypothetical protein [Lambiella insularis]